MEPGKMLGFDMQLQQPPHHQQTPPLNPHHFHQPQIVAFAQQSVKQGYPFPSSMASKSKQPLPVSDDDEHGEDTTNGDGKRKSSPWHRMKWTHDMVRLLVLAVYYIGDDAGSEANDPLSKKKAGGLLQKKGKWKSVSKAMMEKGFYVSPQQCEDKFNDLNKRYKRVNDILGKGTSCRVVENQSLLDTMDLAPKLKEEVRKLLNSKHLFFREMCAYHNSCGHNPATGNNHSPIENPLTITDSSVPKMSTMPIVEEEEDGDDEDSSEDEDDEEEETGHENDDDLVTSSHKRARREREVVSPCGMIQELNCEVKSVMEDGGKSAWEKSRWVKLRLMNMEEQQVKCQYEGFEIEKQRLKWLKFSGKKEREMERAKLMNEKRRLENERMLLLLRHKEFELLQFQHHQQQHSPIKRSEPSSFSG